MAGAAAAVIASARQPSASEPMEQAEEDWTKASRRTSALAPTALPRRYDIHHPSPINRRHPVNSPEIIRLSTTQRPIPDISAEVRRASELTVVTPVTALSLVCFVNSRYREDFRPSGP